MLRESYVGVLGFWFCNIRLFCTLSKGYVISLIYVVIWFIHIYFYEFIVGIFLFALLFGDIFGSISQI